MAAIHRPLPRRQIVRVALPVLAALAVVASETPLRLVPWEDYPILGSFVSGLVFIAVGYFLIDWWVERQETRRWAKVADSAFKSLGHSAEQFGDALQHLLTGRLPTPWSYEPPWPQHFTDRLVEVLAANPSLTALDAEDPAGRRTRARIDVLYDDLAWVDLTVSAMVMLRFAQRRRVAPWLPAMLATSELAGILNRAAGLDDRAADLEWPFLWRLRAVGRDDTALVEEMNTMRRQAGDWWLAALTEATAIHEGLVRAADAGRTDYAFTSQRGRLRLDPVHLAVVDAAHDRGAPLEQPVIGRSSTEVALATRRRWRRTTA